MMRRRSSLPVRVATAAALVLVLAGCTPGGQFDPTAIFNNDMFDNKKKLQGEREPVFPNGVPGTTTGVPPDLVKGYQPPPEADADANANAAPPEPAKPKPKPKVARTPASHPTRISVGPAAGPAAAPAPQGAPAQADGPPPTTPAQQSAQPSPSVWPNPPAPGAKPQ